MWWRRKQNESRKVLTAFAVSLVAHAFIALTIFFSDSVGPQQAVQLPMDVIFLDNFNLNSQNTSFIPQRKKIKKPLQKVVFSEASAAGASQKNDSNEKSLNPDSPIGESDIGSDVLGRAPESETEKYLAEIRDQIARQQTYPAPSRSFREEGTVRIRLTLNRHGSVVKIELIQASPYKRLDDAAIKAVTKSSPFRRFPDEVKFEIWKITLPVRFTLAQNGGP